MMFSSLFKRNIKEKKLIAFSFDDGPSREYTKKILRVLKKNHAKATFFVLGNKIEDNGDILKDIISYGCQIGNHTYNHEKSNVLCESIENTQNLVYKYTNIYPNLLRLPGGEISQEGRNASEKMNLPIIRWSVDSGDWFINNPNIIYRNIINEVNEGSIVLFHDIYDHTLDVIKDVLKTLNKQGYEVTTVQELFDYYNIKLEAGNEYREVFNDEK